MKTTTAVAALSLVVATGCSRKGAGGPARIPVTVARAEQRAVPYEIIATGTVEPRQTVSVQSQVTGVLTQVAFREGDDVAAGQVLFQIDARPFQAALDQARAMLARDQAQAQSAVLDAQRYAELVKQDYVTKSDYEAKRAAAEALQAVVRADSAAVASAALNLDWATIRAPIAGGTGGSEEHTSELQSRLHLVCRLLLEKKKKRDPQTKSKTQQTQTANSTNDRLIEKCKSSPQAST